MRKLLLTAATFLLTFLLMSVPTAAEQLDFDFTFSGKLRPYKTAFFSVSVPCSGELRITIFDEYISYTVFDENIFGPDQLEIPYNALSANGEALRAGQYSIIAALQTEGEVLILKKEITVGKPAAALQYVIPSNDTAFSGQDGFFFDYQLTADGTLNVVLTSAEEEESVLHEWNITVHDQLPHHFNWKGQLKKKNLDEGYYFFSLSVKNSEQEPFQFLIYLSAQKPIEQSLPLSNAAAPAFEGHRTDASVWEALQTPVTVVNIGVHQLQAVYSEPSLKSEIVGRIYGQTQGVAVFGHSDNSFTRIGAWCHENGAYIEGYIPTSKLKVVLPNAHYGIVVRKAEQSMDVYKDGCFVGCVPVSTGLPTEKDPSRETEAGIFLTSDRIIKFETDGYIYHYALRLAGGDLIHSVGCKLDGTKWNDQYERSLLGTKSSHGCIRVDTVCSDSGLNIYWLWTHIPFHTKVLVLD